MIARLDDERGFTLVELLVTMAVLSVVIALITGSAIFLQRNIRETDQRFDDLAQARLAMDASSRWLRTAITVPPYTQPFIEARPGQIEFLANVRVGGASAAPKQVRLRVVNGALEERVYDGTINASGQWVQQAGSVRTRTVARGVTNGTAMFRFFDVDGVELTNGSSNLTETQRSAVRRVAVAFTIRQQPGINTPASQLANRVTLPNQYYFDAQGTL